MMLDCDPLLAQVRFDQRHRDDAGFVAADCPLVERLHLGFR